MAGLLDKLLRRGLITGIYPESVEFRERLRNLLSKPATIYTGFDATAPSLHIGNLATIINSLHFQAHGHRIIFVIGDATTRIGDPSGHQNDRTKLEKEKIEQNARCIEEILRRILRNFNDNFVDTSLFRSNGHVIKQEALIVRNSLWYSDSNVIDFVSDVFREVRVGWLLHKKSIQERLKTQEGMNTAEFCYQIFQGFDWLELWKRYDCKIQIGGSDQGGNIYTGHDLIKRKLNEQNSIGVLAPLITSRGKKIGKSVDNPHLSYWLRPEKTSPFDLYQSFHRTLDSDVERFLKVFSFYEDHIIDDFIRNHLKKPKDIWYCQRKLAEHACLLVHGEEGLHKAKLETDRVYGKRPQD